MSQAMSEKQTTYIQEKINEVKNLQADKIASKDTYQAVVVLMKRKYFDAFLSAMGGLGYEVGGWIPDKWGEDYESNLVVSWDGVK